MARTKQKSTGGKAPRKDIVLAASRKGRPNTGGKGAGAGKTVPAARPHKYRPGTVALREIRHMQKSYELLLPKLTFQRVVREVLENTHTEVSHFTADGIEALQNAAEKHIVDMFEASVEFMVHAKRVTLFQKDVQLARKYARRVSII